MSQTLKTLLWKEWRETRVNFYFALIVVLLLRLLLIYIGYSYYHKWEFMSETFALFSIIFCSIYGLILGLGMFAMEYTTQTFPYLHTRPISKRDIYFFKHIIAIFQIIVLILLVLFLVMILDYQVFLNKLDIYLLYLMPILPFLLFLIGIFSSLIFKDMTKSTVFSLLIGFLTILIISRMTYLFNKSMNIALYTSADLLYWTSQNYLYFTICCLVSIVLYGIINTILFLRQEIK